MKKNEKITYRPMLRQRRARILEYLAARGEMSVSELAELLHATPMTIRTDLARIEEQGRLVRHHGGAVALERKTVLPVTDSNVTRQSEKEKIARRTLSLIKPGDMVLLDTGSTVVELAKIISRIDQVTVITCSLSVLAELYAKPKVRVTLIGGDVSRDSYELYGPLTEQNFSSITADIAVLGADGITIGNGFASNSLPGARVPALMIKAAKKTIVMADHSKLGKTAKITYAQPGEIDLLVTTAPGNDSTVSFLKKQGVEVVNV